MYRKIAVFVCLCGLICNSSGTRMKYERGFPEAIYRGESNMMPETVYNKEPVYHRESILQSEAIMPHQIMRGGAIYGGGETISIKPLVFSQEQYMPSQHLRPIGNEQMMPSEQYVRSEPMIRGETIIRTEPIIRREPVIRAQQIVRAEPAYQSNLRENSLYANEPSPYTVMVTPCSCSACSACSGCSSCTACSQAQASYSSPPSGPQESYYPVQRQTVMSEPTVLSQQSMMAQHFIPQRITYQKPATVMKPTYFVALPRIQRFVRKSYRPITDKVQITTVPIQSASEMTNFQVQPSEPVQFSNNVSSYQNQAPVQDHTPQPQTTPVTSRSSSDRFQMPPVSSIC